MTTLLRRSAPLALLAASAVSLASLGSLGRSVALRLSPDGRTAVIVYENGDLFSYSGSVANGTLTYNIALAPAVPEPSTYALVIAGLAVAGAAARRKKA